MSQRDPVMATQANLVVPKVPMVQEVSVAQENLEVASI